MANYQTHATFGVVSGAVVVGSAHALGYYRADVETVLLGAFFGFLGGLIPDLDHDRGRPLRIIGALLSTLMPILIVTYWLPPSNRWKWILLSLEVVIPLHYILHWIFDQIPFWKPYSNTTIGMALEAIFVSAICSVLALWLWAPPGYFKYLSLMLGISVGIQLLIPIFKWATVHRGCFHSIPTALIFAELVFLYTYPFSIKLRVIFALSALLGAISHLLLDELYSIDFDGKQIRVKRSWGTAFKLWEENYPITSSLFWSTALIGAFVSLSTLPKKFLPSIFH